MYDMITVDWHGKRLTGAQALVVLRAAGQFPAKKKDAVMEFEHELCEGVITCKGDKVIGTFAGTVFHAYLGTYKGKPWTYEFLVAHGFDARETYESPVGEWVSRTGSGATIDLVNQLTIKRAKTRIVRKN